LGDTILIPYGEDARGKSRELFQTIDSSTTEDDKYRSRRAHVLLLKSSNQARAEKTGPRPTINMAAVTTKTVTMEIETFFVPPEEAAVLVVLVEPFDTTIHSPSMLVWFVTTTRFSQSSARTGRIVEALAPSVRWTTDKLLKPVIP
jgi:hypothetical protein